MGKKSAQRIAYHLVCNDQFLAHKISHAIEEALLTVRRCKKCKNISEHELCDICADEDRNHSLLLVVTSPKDILCIEQSGGFDGCYFVLEEASVNEIDRLRQRAEDGVMEIVFAFTPSVSNDALIVLLEDRLAHIGVKFSKIAQGVPTGVSLENVDTLSLAKAIASRVDA